MPSLHAAQIRGILRLELKRNLLSLRAFPIYLLALLPVGAVLLFVAVSTALDDVPSEFQGPGGAAQFFNGLFRFILHIVVYFGSVWTFMNLFRAEILDRSLHYLFLTPVRRDVLATGKFISAWATTTILFGASTVFCFVVIYAYLGGASTSLLGPAGHLLAYLSVVALACLGYGAVFMFIGLFVRNPIVPALLFFLWEGINGWLPSLLKKASVVFYLQGLLPVPLPEGMVAFVVDPVSPWLAVPGMILFTSVVLFFASLRVRTMEVAYGDD